MGQECLLSVQSAAIATVDKWCSAIKPDAPLLQAARDILGSRLHIVQQRLSLAALESDKDVEHVHQLRIATRRAVATLRLFSRLTSGQANRTMRDSLRQIRVAADAARNWDVLAQLLRECPDISGASIVDRMVEEIGRRRQAAQQPIVTVHEHCLAENLDKRVHELLEGLRCGKHGRSKRNYGRYARSYLRRVLRRFFEMGESDLSDEESLHRFRVCAKKLRYTMEMVAVAFDTSFRKELYPQVSVLQDLMGVVNDHAMGKAFFHEWSDQSQEPQEKAFLAGIVLTEDRAYRDVRQAFFALWTPRFMADLRCQFEAHDRAS